MNNAIRAEYSMRRKTRFVQTIEGGHLLIRERAADALRAAKITIDWKEYEWDEHSTPEAGDVRLRIEPDDSIDLSWLDQSHYSAKYRKEQIDRADRDGAWGVIGEYFDGETWHHADSCWGFIGDDWKDSGYDIDIKAETLANAAYQRLEPAEKWDDDQIQFPRLLAEIIATQDALDLPALAESMDLTVDRVNELFDRAQTAWDAIKER